MIEQFYTNKSILITGCTGFVGKSMFGFNKCRQGSSGESSPQSPYCKECLCCNCAKGKYHHFYCISNLLWPPQQICFQKHTFLK